MSEIIGSAGLSGDDFMVWVCRRANLPSMAADFSRGDAERFFMEFFMVEIRRWDLNRGMTTLLEAGKVLLGELTKADAALKSALPVSKRLNLEMELFEVERSEEMTEKLDFACRFWIQYGKWPRMDSEEAVLIFARLQEGEQFARWLGLGIPQIGKQDMPWWLEFLIVDYWNFLGSARWRERVRDLSGWNLDDASDE